MKYWKDKASVIINNTKNNKKYIELITIIKINTTGIIKVRIGEIVR